MNEMFIFTALCNAGTILSIACAIFVVAMLFSGNAYIKWLFILVMTGAISFGVARASFRVLDQMEAEQTEQAERCDNE